MQILSEEGLIALSQHFADINTIDDKKLDSILLQFSYSEFSSAYYSDELMQSFIDRIPKKDEDNVSSSLDSKVYYQITRQTKERVHTRRIPIMETFTLKQYKERLVKDTLMGIRTIRARMQDYEKMSPKELQNGILEYTLMLAKKLSAKAGRYADSYLERRDAFVLEELIKKNGDLSLPEMAKHIHNNYLDDKRAIDCIESMRTCGMTDEKIAEKIVEKAIDWGIREEIKQGLQYGAYRQLGSYVFSDECGLLEKICGKPGEFSVNTEKVKRLGWIPFARMGFDISAIAIKEYAVGGEKGIKPELMRDEFALSFAEYCEKTVSSEKEQKKVQLIKRVLDNDGSLVMDEYMGAISKATRQRLDEKIGRIMLKNRFGSLSGDEKREIKKEMINEMKIMLQSKPKNPKTKSLELVAEKFHPEEYRIEGEYLFRLTKNAEEMQAATKAAESCIRKRGIEFYSKDLSDRGAICLTAFHNNEIKGYVRMFLMGNDKNEPVLAIDTIEPPKQNFDGSKDLIKAMCLAAIELGMDIGAKQVVCNDARINYGPKEAFGNTERKVKLMKLGRKDTTYYKMRHEYSGDVFVLMQNWRK
ncbi:MAG: hypothetical protein PHO02_02020 [Candidatus Nanoarchaeia archaeon]|nr:hypothetical protein [Candidatus Nanoarchaeia archaeon]